MLMDPIFPIEIFNLIITQVAQASQMKDLCSCSLVCQDFLSLCRPHIFKRLSIRLTAYVSSDKARLWRLLEILDENPTLKDYIQEISYTHKGGATKDAIDLALPGLGSGLAIFLCLPNVHCLEIRSEDTWYIECDTYRPNTFCAPTLIERYMASGKLTRLLLNRVVDPPLISILSQETLVELEIQDVEFSEWDQNQHMPPLNNNALRKLRCQGIYTLPLSIIRSFSYLEDLQIRDCSEGLDGEDFPSGSFESVNVEAPMQLGRLRTLTTFSDVDWRAILGTGHSGVKALPALIHLIVELQEGHNIGMVNTIVDHIDILEKLEVKGALCSHFEPVLRVDKKPELQHLLPSNTISRFECRLFLVPRT
ncbi:hypothetical protein BJ165DRAFT_1452262 [Panaeolus papilionaceus]|nr:hypothetical protein BJ165DRAFT_1452262 [Panaeolus papilionaceus]